MKRSEVPHQQQSPTKVLAFDFRPAAINGEWPSSNLIWPWILTHLWMIGSFHCHVNCQWDFRKYQKNNGGPSLAVWIWPLQRDRNPMAYLWFSNVGTSCLAFLRKDSGSCHVSSCVQIQIEEFLRRGKLWQHEANQVEEKGVSFSTQTDPSGNACCTGLAFKAVPCPGIMAYGDQLEMQSLH